MVINSSTLIYDPLNPEAISYISTPGKPAQTFTGSEVETIIAVYTKPDDGTRNKITVYKLYPYKMLDAVFPSQQDGVEPYLNPPARVVYSKDDQTVSMNVSSNVSYSCKTDGSEWIQINQAEYTPTDTGISFHLDENTDSADSRTALIYFYCTEPDVSDEDRNTLTAFTEVIQEIGNALAEQNTANDAQAATQQAADEANQRTDDLPDPEDPDGGDDGGEG